MSGKRVISTNKKAYHEYFVEETLEAGIELAGTEVKALRQGSVNLKDCYCRIIDGEIYVLGMHISPYEKGNIFNRAPLRDRRLAPAQKGDAAPVRAGRGRRATQSSRCRSIFPAKGQGGAWALQRQKAVR